MSKKKITFITIFTIIILIMVSMFLLLDSKHPLILFLVASFITVKVHILVITKVLLSKILYILKASKSKILLFIKGLTITKTLTLAIKRFFIDNVFSKWLDKHIISHIKEPMSGFFNYYRTLNWKRKFQEMLALIIPLSIITILAQYMGWLEHLFFYVEIKALVISFFKFIWMFMGKTWAYIMFFLKNTWIGTILEIFALSWVLSKLEKLPYIGKPLRKFLKKIEIIISRLFRYIGKLYDRYLGKLFNRYLSDYIKKISEKMTRKLEKIKIDNEIYSIKYFRDNFLNKDIEKYFDNIDKYSNKEEFYKRVNKISNDTLDIVGYVEIDDNSIETLNDVLIIEGSASSDKSGNITTKIDKNSFWVLNMSSKDLWMFSEDNSFSPKYIKKQKLRLIKSTKQDLDKLYFIDNDENIYRVRKLNESR